MAQLSVKMGQNESNYVQLGSNILQSYFLGVTVLVLYMCMSSYIFNSKGAFFDKRVNNINMH